MTRTMEVDPEQYRQLCKAAQDSGRPVSEIVREALIEWIACSPKAPEGDVTQAERERG